jgi:hypothetical protein
MPEQITNSGRIGRTSQCQPGWRQPNWFFNRPCPDRCFSPFAVIAEIGVDVAPSWKSDGVKRVRDGRFAPIVLKKSARG